MVASDRIAAPFYCHENDREPVAERTPVYETFSDRHMLDNDFEVIPTPGHTRGATAFHWANGSHRFLFTSDSIYLREGEWVAMVLEESDRESYLKSLELIRDLDFDVLVPWAATNGRPVPPRLTSWMSNAPSVRSLSVCSAVRILDRVDIDLA